MASSAVFQLIFLYTAELFPTLIRNTALGFSSTASGIGSVGAPFVIGLGGIGGVVSAFLRKQGLDVSGVTTNPKILKDLKTNGFSLGLKRFKRKRENRAHVATVVNVIIL